MPADTDFVCLYCYNVWRGRREDTERRQCSECKRRLVAPFHSFEQAVNDAREWLQTKQKFYVPFAPLSLTPALRSAFAVLGEASPKFPEGVAIFDRILSVAAHYDPKKETLRACLLRLRTSLGPPLPPGG